MAMSVQPRAGRSETAKGRGDDRTRRAKPEDLRGTTRVHARARETLGAPDSRRSASPLIFAGCESEARVPLNCVVRHGPNGRHGNSRLILPLCRDCERAVRATAFGAELELCPVCTPKLHQVLRVMLTGHPCIAEGRDLVEVP